MHVETAPALAMISASLDMMRKLEALVPKGTALLVWRNFSEIVPFAPPALLLLRVFRAQFARLDSFPQKQEALVTVAHQEKFPVSQVLLLVIHVQPGSLKSRTSIARSARLARHLLVATSHAQNAPLDFMRPYQEALCVKSVRPADLQERQRQNAMHVLQVNSHQRPAASVRAASQEQFPSNKVLRFVTFVQPESLKKITRFAGIAKLAGHLLVATSHAQNAPLDFMRPNRVALCVKSVRPADLQERQRQNAMHVLQVNSHQRPAASVRAASQEQFPSNKVLRFVTFVQPESLKKITRFAGIAKLAGHLLVATSHAQNAPLDFMRPNRVALCVKSVRPADLQERQRQNAMHVLQVNSHQRPAASVRVASQEQFPSNKVLRFVTFVQPESLKKITRFAGIAKLAGHLLVATSHAQNAPLDFMRPNRVALCVKSVRPADLQERQVQNATSVSQELYPAAKGVMHVPLGDLLHQVHFTVNLAMVAPLLPQAVRCAESALLAMFLLQAALHVVPVKDFWCEMSPMRCSNLAYLTTWSCFLQSFHGLLAASFAICC